MFRHLTRTLAVAFTLAFGSASAETINANPGFEQGFEGWNIYNPIAGLGASVSLVRDGSGDAFVIGANSGFGEGKSHVRMFLPRSAVDNYTQYINLGQNLTLSKDRRYRYSVRLKWANQGAANAPSQAIVSTWVRNPDGSYSGKDIFIGNSDETIYSFEFTPNQDGTVFAYIALLTNIEGPRDTEVLVDDLGVEDVGPAAVEPDGRMGNLLAGSAFTFPDTWQKTEWNPNGVSGLSTTPVSVDGNAKMQLSLPGSGNPDYLNETFTGVYQTVRLYAGNTYELSANIDRVTPADDSIQTILNLYAHLPGDQPVWLGDVDYAFSRTDNHYYAQSFYVTRTGDYQITARNFGWAQNGTASTVLVDNLKLFRVVPNG